MVIKNDPEIEAMMDEVDMEIISKNLQHMQDYGTRNAYTPQSVLAQNWIKEQFESYGYKLNCLILQCRQGQQVIMLSQQKLEHYIPDEYVIIGGHYDSYSYSGNAPGADDDAQEFAE